MQNLFSINRFPGIDRFEGRTTRQCRACTPNGRSAAPTSTRWLGQSYREHLDKSLPLLVGPEPSRLGHRRPRHRDTRQLVRYDGADSGLIRAMVTSALAKLLRPRERRFFAPLWDISIRRPTRITSMINRQPPTDRPGYPASYFVPRDEVTLGASSAYGPYKVSGYVRRDLTLSKLVGIGAKATYEDECFIFDLNFFRRYTSINNDNGGTTLLFQDHAQDRWAVRVPRLSNGHIVMRLIAPATLLSAALLLSGAVEAATSARPSRQPGDASAGANPAPGRERHDPSRHWKASWPWSMAT